jgi:hypothetical protein
MGCRNGPRQAGLLLPGMVGQCGFVQAPLPAPPHALSLTNPALGANSCLKVMVPKTTNITFWEQLKKKKKGCCYGL